jgi:hypothetical protein
MKKREMRELVANLSMAEIEKMLHILEVEMRERFYEENPEEWERVCAERELEQMEPYSELAH